MPTENLYKSLKPLSIKERAVLCNMLQRYPAYKDIHQGILPFLKRDEVLKAMNAIAWVSNIHRRIYLKLLGSVKSGGKVLVLNDGKVFARFGKHPERGVFIPILPMVHRVRCPKATCLKNAKACKESGICERQPFERKKDAYDVQYKTVSLTNVGHNRWVLYCRDDDRAIVVQWLNENLT